MSDTIENAIRQEFLLEAAELLEGCEASFLELEQNPEDKTILDSIFRLAHTLKGSGLAAGFDHLAGFAHQFEALLDELRNGKLRLSPDLVELLLRSNDFLGKYIGVLQSDHTATVDYSELETEIAGVLRASGDPTPEQSDSPGALQPQRTMVLKQESFPFENLKVLVVDDDISHLDLISYALEDLNVEILMADSAKKALETYEQDEPNLIISDLKMPGMNGIEFAREIKSKMRFTPMIFCSGFAGRDDLAEFIKLGAVGFVEKPYDPEHLKLMTEQALHKSITRDCVIKLARLAYQSYRLSSKMATKFADHPDSGQLETLQKLESTLDQISEYSRFIVSPDSVLSASVKKKKPAA